MKRFVRRLAGRLDYLRKPERRNRVWPMNGQQARLEAVREVIDACRIEQIVETGTHLGYTADWFAQLGPRVTTVELNPRWFEVSRLRLRKYGHVRVIEGRSIEVLRDLVNEAGSRERRIFFYLDAHWFEHLPLAEELVLIARHFPKAVILIDDFQVPDDPGYGFDDYGSGKRISLEYVANSGASDWTAYFPRASSQDESGRRRGWVVLTADPAMISTLDKVASLRRLSATAA